MKKEFVPYEQALALKELGFYEPCFAKYFQQDGNTPFIQIGETEIEEAESSGGDVTFECDVPLYQQAFRWFREKYDLVIEPCVPFQRLYSTEEDHFEILEFGYRIYSFDQFRGGLRDKIEWDGYDNSNEEETELECLKKLIEIVKEDK